MINALAQRAIEPREAELPVIGPAGRVVPSDPAAALLPIEAADLLGTSPRTLETWRSRGEGPPYVKVGAKAIRYPRGPLLEWLRSRTVAA